jgi:hypothetical protein
LAIGPEASRSPITWRAVSSGIVARSCARSSSASWASRARAIDGPGLRADRPLVSPADDLDGEAPGIRLGMTGRTERHQAVEIEVRAPLGALDDVVDLEGAPAATGLAPPVGAPKDHLGSK